MAAFIARERELAVLGSAVQRAAEGPARVVISGDLGMGSTRLLDELVARARADRSLLICRARCDEPRVGVPYAVLREALGPALGRIADARLPEVVGAGGFDIGALFPEVAGRLERDSTPVQPPAFDSPRQRGARVREALIGLVERIAGNGRLCLIIEDLEHSDPGTREFVGALMRTSRRLPLSLIVSFHPDEVGRDHPARSFLDELAGSGEADALELRELDVDEIATIAADELGERPTLAFVSALNEGSGGNPLLAEQLIAAQQQLAGTRLSDPLGEIVDARLEQLEPAQARILQVLAAARSALSSDQLAALTLRDGHLPRNAPTLALETGLALEMNGGFAISHPLLAEAIEKTMLPGERHSLHASLAELLGADAPAEAAWHWQRAGRTNEARAAHLAAGALAQRLEPGETALGHFVAALELTADGADPAGKEGEIEVLAAAAAAADTAGAFRRAAALCGQAIERVAGGRVERLVNARASAAARGRAAALCERLGEYRRSSGDSAGARQAFEQALAVAPNEPGAQAAALAALAQQLMLEGEFEESALRADQARTAARTAGDMSLASFAHATDTAAVDAGFLGHIDRALLLIDEALTAARSAGQLDEIMRCYANKTTLLDLDLRREQALAVVNEGIEEAARSGLGLSFGAFLRGNAADILFQLGRWPEAEQECRAATEFPPVGVAWYRILSLGLVLVESRADDEAAQLVGRTLLQLETVPAGQWSALVLRAAVSLALWRTDIADAMNAAEQGWQRVLEADDPALIVVASATVLEACAEAADRGRAVRDWSAVAQAGTLASEVIPIAQQSLAQHPLPKSVGARREAELYMATALAHNERVRGRAKPETWATLAEAWARIPVPYQVAKARWWQAQAALPTRARRAEARRALIEAWRISESLPAGPLHEALRDLAQRGRITLPAEKQLVAIPIEPEERELVAVGPGPNPGNQDQPAALARFGLSPREFSVLLVLAEGRTNREIAERLFISERTVAVHVRRILAKLHVSGRVEAAGVAIRLGLLPDDPRLAESATR